MLDVTPYDLAQHEIDQQRETGHDVSSIARAFSSTHPEDVAALENLLVELARLPQAANWDYEEPESLPAILESLGRFASPTTPVGIPNDVLDDKILGAWLGRIAGCNVGKPIENGLHWTAAHIRSYLELAGAWPLRDYIPMLDPLPDEYHFQPCWVATTRGNVNGSDHDDDIDYSILALHLLEQHGASLTPALVGDSWQTLLPFHQVWTAERAAYKNLVDAVPIAEVARRRNPYREWIGALIRGDVYGWVSPDEPIKAVTLAYQDATLSHTANGVYGELWSAALMAGAFTAANAREAVERSLGFVPPRSRLAEALRFVVDLRDAGSTWEQAITAIQRSYGHYHWVHTIPNAALIVAGLLWGEDDFASTVGLTVSGGWDTDCTGATAGAVSGILNGARNLPEYMIRPLRDTTRSALFGFDNSSIPDLAMRTSRLARSGLGS